MIAWDTGMSPPPPMPCRMRARIIISRERARPHSREAAVNRMKEKTKKRLRPIRVLNQAAIVTKMISLML